MRTPTSSRRHPSPSYCVAASDLRVTPADLEQLLEEEATLHEQLADIVSQCRWFDTTPAFHRDVADAIERLARRVRALPCGNPAAARRLHAELLREGSVATGALALAHRVVAAAIRDHLLDRGALLAVAERPHERSEWNAERTMERCVHRDADGVRA